MSDGKETKVFEVNPDNTPKELGVILGFALMLIEKGTLREQEAFGTMLMKGMMGEKAKDFFVHKYPKLPDDMESVMESILKSAMSLMEDGQHSTMLVAYAAAKRTLALEAKVEKLTEMLVKDKEGK